MKTQGVQFRRKRKLLLVLPLLALPFITLAFWAMGGGEGTDVQPATQQGLNPALPQAKLSAYPTDKMSIYSHADRDSLARRQDQGLGTLPASDSIPGELAPLGSNNSYQGYSGLQSYSDPNEMKVKDRLASLERALREPVTQPVPAYGPINQGPGQNSMGTDLDRLEQMMQTVTGGSAADPEMQQLSEMMEKVLDLQYPERARQKLQELSQKNKGRVYPVNLYRENKEVAVISRPDKAAVANDLDRGIPSLSSNSFYGLAALPVVDSVQTAIPAVVHETQTLVSGSTIKLRLTEDILVSGMLIPAGNFIFGTCNISGERLRVEITGVRYGKSLFPVALTVFDLDALEGIRIPGAISRDAAKDGSDRALQSVQFMSLDPSIASQAAGVGVEAAKGLFSKKAKLIRVTVKAGYPILLMDEKTRQQQSN